MKHKVRNFAAVKIILEKEMKRIFNLLLLLLVSTVFCVQAGAENEAEVAKLGTIRGRIVDAEKHVLPGASVYVENLKNGTISDIDGFYVLSNLKPGVYKIKVTYVGYHPQEFTMEVGEGKTIEREIVMDEGVELQEVVVRSAMQGQRKALNAQKTQIGIVNIVSADQVGKFPDSNIGDALKRISGINVQYDQGEARFGQVRGTSPDLSSVTINGNRLPSAEGDIRNVQLDLIPADMIQTIEVNKVVTSDMDGDAIGGSINLVTKSSPYQRVFNAMVGSGYNVVSKDAQLNLGLTYGDRFYNDKLGIMLSLSYQNAPIGSDDVEFEYDRDEDTGEVFITDAETRQYYVTRQRQSYSLSLDYVINPNHKLMFKGIYNRRHDWENRYAQAFKDLDSPGEMESEIETKGGSSDNRNARLELQQTMDLTLSGEHLFGRLGMDWAASYSRASEDRPEERYFKLKQKDLDFDIVDAGKRFPYIDNDVNLHDGSWEVDELTNSNQDIHEEDMKFHLNFDLPLVQGEYANKLKFGAKYVRKTKTKDIKAYDYVDAYGEDNTEYMSHLSTQVRDGYFPGAQYRSIDFVQKEYLGEMDFAQMAGNPVWEDWSENYDATENVTSAFVRFDQNFTPRHQLVVGLRMEATRLKYQGWNWNVDEDENESLVHTGVHKNNYVNFLPSVLYKFNVNEDLKLRASFTETLARPKYSSLVPSVHINLHDEEVSIGNPDLTPTLSYNFDLSMDYYFKSIGLVSAGVFYKRIDDFIVDQRTSGAYEGYPDMDFDRITKSVNGGDANLLGVEVAYQRDFGFIAPALKCLGLYGNYTYTYTEVDNFNFEGRENEKGLSLPGSPKHTANASLYFEKKGFNVRLSYNFASAFIDEMGEHAELDRYYDAVNYLDANASYTFGRKVRCTVYAEASNLLNQPLRYYQGKEERTMQAEYYGVKANAGVKISF